MNRSLRLLLSLSLLPALVNCASAPANTIKEVGETEVRGCKPLGQVNGSDAIFVGLSASIGSKNAHARALTQAVELKATHVAWSQMGTSMSNEWVGKAYLCR